jgi:transcriptional regulator with XRE-family HTH domain
VSVEEEIKRLRAEGKRYRDICKELRVSPSYVKEVLKGSETARDPIALLERKAETEERKARALRRIEKARETLNEPNYS